MNRKRAPRISDARGRIVTAALRLFAREGIGNVSLRAVIAAAGVNPSAVHYHFGSRRALLREVFRVVRTPLNEERRRLLAQAMMPAGKRPSLRAVLHARFWPIFRRLAETRDRTAAQELAFICQLRQDPSSDAVAVLAEHDIEVEQLLEAATSQALPELDIETLRVRLHLANSAAWDVVGQSDALDWLGANAGRSVRRLYDCFLDFIVAGFMQGVVIATSPNGRSVDRPSTKKISRRSANRR